MNPKRKPLFFILAGDGINCERETAEAFTLAGTKAKIVHINDLLHSPRDLAEAHGLALPGGFSFGDELGSGQVLALKIKYGLEQEWPRFLEEKKPIIGICNGFQVLLKLGVLPQRESERTLTLSPNEGGKFINRWVSLERPSHSVCKWTQGIEEKFSLPVRHGEGRLTLVPGREKEIHQNLQERGQIALQYRENVNGSYGNINGPYGGIAGLTDSTGLILGLMPHPEAAIWEWAYPRRQRPSTPGRIFFNNIVNYLWQT